MCRAVKTKWPQLCRRSPKADPMNAIILPGIEFGKCVDQTRQSGPNFVWRSPKADPMRLRPRLIGGSTPIFDRTGKAHLTCDRIRRNKRITPTPISDLL
ncbi:hypothetical protein T265_00129 [Opisthorchis viverrini]|uniref:Uncharacterized protein n=1 Tax=Opisthorchis viverrini TaxID=6198 RepID=A0A075A7D5_OPIVI|nr:hypothetical protein T265_00129 [Opisthorchis viverrini]KER34282.1 hypothetical protein T265_00129 [Opisthorchis viverrini]